MWDLPDPGIEPVSLMSPALTGGFFTTSTTCEAPSPLLGMSFADIFPHPWDSPGKNTGVGFHFLLQCKKVKSESEASQSCPTLATPWTAAYQAPPSMGFSRQKYWSGCHCLLHWNAVVTTQTQKTIFLPSSCALEVIITLDLLTGGGG